MENIIKEYLDGLPGKISFSYKNLITGKTIEYQVHEQMLPASVIKLFVMVEAFQQIESGTLRKNQIVIVNHKDCVPSCGALTYMHDGLQVTILDLITLMIIVSDNTATNLLIDILGIEQINQTMLNLGFEKTCLRRKMFDTKRAAEGIENSITASDITYLLEQLYLGNILSKKSSEEMLSILKNQRLNGKIPFYLHALQDAPVIAHKTGEDTGITHDVGIVYAKEPFILCFLGNNTEVPTYEKQMANIAMLLYNDQQTIGIEK